MQEVVVLLSSVAGLASAVALRRYPRGKNRNTDTVDRDRIEALRMEEEILGKAMKKLYQDETITGTLRDRLVQKYHRQAGSIRNALEELEASRVRQNMGPAGQEIITRMDKRLATLDDRLSEISARMAVHDQTYARKSPDVRREPAAGGARVGTTGGGPVGVTAKAVRSEVPDAGRAADITGHGRPDSPSPIFGGTYRDSRRIQVRVTDMQNRNSMINPRAASKTAPGRGSVVPSAFPVTRQARVPIPTARKNNARRQVPDNTVLKSTAVPSDVVVKMTAVPGNAAMTRAAVPSDAVKSTAVSKDTVKSTASGGTVHKNKMPEPKPLPPNAVHEPDGVALDDDIDDLEEVKRGILKTLSKLEQAEVE